MSDGPVIEGLADYRALIDDLDAQVLGAMASRFETVEAIGRLKREAGVAVFQPQRRQRVMDRYRELGASLGLSEEFTERLALLVLEQAHRLEDRVVAEGSR